MQRSFQESRVIFDPGPFQNNPQFLERTPMSMVFLLVVDVAPHLVQAGGTYHNGGVAFLPGKRLQRNIRMNP